MRHFLLLSALALCACRLDALGPRGHSSTSPCQLWAPIYDTRSGAVLGYIAETIDCNKYNADSLVALGWRRQRP